MLRCIYYLPIYVTVYSGCRAQTGMYDTGLIHACLGSATELWKCLGSATELWKCLGSATELWKCLGSATELWKLTTVIIYSHHFISGST